MANRYLRDRAIEEAQRSIQYLNAELERVTTIEIRASIYRLMEKQVQDIMYANVLDEYAFKIIDPAIAPEIDNYVRPNRTIMAALSVVIGFILALCFAVVVAFKRSLAL